MDTQKRVTAVVVTYQSASTIKLALAASRRCHEAGLLDCIYVDNNSADSTPEILLAESDWAEIILTKANNGFGRGCNIGLAKVTTPYTLFLNPDAHAEPAALQGMVEFMDANPSVGIIGPATLCGNPGDTEVYQGTGALPTPWTLLQNSIPLLRFPSLNHIIEPGSQPFRTGWVCGAVLLIRTELAKRMGGFDPRFFLYYEEMDLCQRAESLGFETWAIGTVLAHHTGGASSVDDDTRVAGCIGKHFYQSRRYYMIKHHGWFAATALDVGELLFLGLRTLADMLRGKGVSRIRPRMQAGLFSLPVKV